MAIYVDNMRAPFKPGHRPGRTYVMCHMIADTDEELHAMAAKIGVARKWYQGDHYDIALSKRKLAVENGAREITLRQLACMSGLRRRGQPMGDPDTAVARRQALGATNAGVTIFSAPADANDAVNLS